MEERQPLHPPPAGDSQTAPAATGPAPSTVLPAIGDPSPDAAVLDLAPLRQLEAALGRRAATLLPQLIDAFFEDAVELRMKAQQALAQGSPEAVRQAAHTLKSSSAMFGAHALAALCRDLEHRAASGNLEHGAAALAQIEAEYARASVALEAARQELQL